MEDRAFGEDVARRYGHSDLDRLQAKLRYFSLAEPIDTIVNGRRYALDGQEAEAWRLLRERLRANSY
jgi:hypothetical protein